MPTCRTCGTETNALHTAGDGNVPKPGVCADCHEDFAVVGRIQRAKARDARRAALVAKAGDA